MDENKLSPLSGKVCCRPTYTDVTPWVKNRTPANSFKCTSNLKICDFDIMGWTSQKKLQ